MTCAPGRLPATILTALYVREKTGEGQYCDTALFDAVIAVKDAEKEARGGEYLRAPRPSWNNYLCKDGKYIAFAAGEAIQWTNLCNAIGLPQYVNDRGNHRVQVFDEFGKYLYEWHFGDDPSDIHLLYIGADRTLWAFDRGTSRMVKYDLQGHLLYSWGTWGDFPGGFWGVHGMSVDQQGNLYVAAGLHKPRGTSETLDTRPGLHVFSSQGKLLAFVETPEDTVTNCAFGGITNPQVQRYSPSAGSR